MVFSALVVMRRTVNEFECLAPFGLHENDGDVSTCVSTCIQVRRAYSVPAQVATDE